MVRSQLLALVLFSVCGVGCSDSSSPTNANVASPTSDGSLSTSVGVNGPHSGEIWIARWSGSKRFNLQTGEETDISTGVAIPSRDGTVFLEYLPDNGIIQHDYCPIAPSYYDAQVFSVKDTRTDEVFGTFKLGVEIGAELRLSPDGSQIAMYAAENRMLCDDNIYNKRFTVFSKDGKQLYRNTDGHFASFDWHPDGRLVVLQRLVETDRGFAVKIETEPGSYKFSGESTSYIVPVEVKLQPMPPTQYSEKIRPVFGSQKQGAFSTIGFNPIYGLSWTPVIN